MSDLVDLQALGRKMREDSERWFPGLHDGATSDDMRVFYMLGLAGEVGEVANLVKKIHRDGRIPEGVEGLGPEIADCFTYLLLLADEAGVDVLAEYEAKAARNEERWGPRPPLTVVPDG